MRFFYDTEFVDDGSTIQLISIAIVTEGGERFYAVNSDMPVSEVRDDYWLLENVWRHLPTRGMRTGIVSTGGGRHENRVTNSGVLDTCSPLVRPAWVIRNEVREFFAEHGASEREENELWADYGAYDHVALAQMFGPMIYLPTGIPMWTHDLQQLIGAHPDIPLPARAGSAHHALADALHVREQWAALACPKTKGGKGF